MSDSQLDETEAYTTARAGFLSWKDNEATWRQGSGAPEHGQTPDVRCRYIPMSVLKRDFSKSRIQRLLDDVFYKSEKTAPDAETILKHYLRPFLILMCIGHPTQISLFLNYDLKDECLPFQTMPCGLSGSKDWFPDFYENQWQFYPVQFTYNMDRELSTKHVLPMIYIRKLGRGGSAVTHQIRIDTEYNGLRHSSHGELDILQVIKDTYVVKTFQTAEARDDYETECNGFRNLRYHAKPPANIIAFYGNFMWGSCPNILLEYADRGTLKQYMEDVEPPTRREHIEQFWHNILALFDGLVTIHGKSRRSPSGKRKFMIGWHQDLTPSNILVLSGKSGTPYDCQFKIADLEHSHFERSRGVLDAKAKDSQGTFAYGPPEVSRLDPVKQGWPLQVDRRVDVWAMGCILSEVAVWVALGKNKFDQYRMDRLADFLKRRGEGGHCFHDGDKVLAAVHSTHSEAKQDLRARDQWTGQIITMIEKDMMLVEPTSRKTAKNLYDICEHITVSPSVAGVQPPPVGHSPSSAATALPPKLEISTHGETSQPSPPFYPHFRKTRVQEAHARKSPGTKANADEHYQEKSSDTDTSLDSDIQRRRGDSGTPMRRRSPQTYPGIQTNPKPSRGESEDTERSLERSPVNGNSVPPSHGTRRVQERKYAGLSLTDALKLVEGKKWGIFSRFARSSAPDKLVRSLKGRNHVFIVDMSPFMDEHQSLMEKWLKVLGYMVQNADPDGMDVYFTGSLKRLKAKSWMELVSRFHHQSFEDTTRSPHLFEVPHLIKHILQDYQNRLSETHCIKHFFRIGGMPKNGPRNMSMYVLTNGDWRKQRDLENQIRALVKRLDENGMNNSKVGIQFLRFGDITQGIENLGILDHELGVKLDLIDTEPAHGGDVYKAMLGPIDENHDDDPPPSTTTVKKTISDIYDNRKAAHSRCHPI